MRFFMITTVAASVAVAIAMPAPDGREALCNAGASIPLCCSTDVLGAVDLDCGPRESSLRLGITGNRLSNYSLPHTQYYP
jgi:hypothetical protein